jgi:hypothetical protein
MTEIERDDNSRETPDAHGTPVGSTVAVRDEGAANTTPSSFSPPDIERLVDDYGRACIAIGAGGYDEERVSNTAKALVEAFSVPTPSTELNYWIWRRLRFVATWGESLDEAVANIHRDARLYAAGIKRYRR